MEAAPIFTIGSCRREKRGFQDGEIVLKHVRKGCTCRKLSFIMPKSAPNLVGRTIINEGDSGVRKNGGESFRRNSVC